MSSAVRYTKPEVQDRIARDYVMGTLSLAASKRCEKLRRELPELNAKIYEWSEKLQPLADVVPESTPAKDLWAKIEHSTRPVGQHESTDESGPYSFWQRLPFLRGLAAASSFVALLLIALQVTQPTPVSLDYIAVLENSSGDLQFVATAMEATKQLTLQTRGDALPTNSAYQLWAISKTDGEARSLGLIAANSASTRTLNETDWRLIGDAFELLITAEMPGGSAIGEPSDDVISRGLCVRLSAS